MPNEWLLLKQMLGGDGWLSIAMLVGIFWIVLYRRESIALPGLFRLGVVFFALSIAIPPLIAPMISTVGGTRAFRNLGAGADAPMLLSLFLNGTGPVLQALTVLCVFNALMPRVFNQKPETTIPQKHPLDD